MAKAKLDPTKDKLFYGDNLQLGDHLVGLGVLGEGDLAEGGEWAHGVNMPYRGARSGGFLPWLAGRGSGRDDPRAGKVSVLVGGLGCATRTDCRVGALQQGAHSGDAVAGVRREVADALPALVLFP